MATDPVALWEAYDEEEVPCDCPFCCPYDDFGDDEEEGVCFGCGATEDEECEPDCPSWDEED